MAYLLSNRDLAAAGFNAQNVARHWISYGAKEGRSASGLFGTEQVDHALTIAASKTGAFDRVGDRDWFKIDLTAGDRVTFDLTTSTGNGVLAVYDAMGHELAADGVSGTSTRFLANTAGVYYVTASATGTATGNYTLSYSTTATITGTNGADTLTGTAGDDVISALAGDDYVDAGGGSDTVYGGTGDDALSGGLGADRLYGEAGNDSIYGGQGSDILDGGDGNDSLVDSDSGSDTLRGGAGQDFLSVQHSSGSSGNEVILIDAGADDDRVVYYSSVSGRTTIDLGAGNDNILIDQNYYGVMDITLGLGKDTFNLYQSYYINQNSNQAIRFTDFAAGTNGDVLNINDFLTQNLINWDGSNPFGTGGYLRLVQSGSDTLLQLDRDGSANGNYSYNTLFTLENSTASQFTAANFSGLAPNGTSASGSAFIGNDNDALDASVVHGLGNDLTVLAPDYMIA